MPHVARQYVLAFILVSSVCSFQFSGITRRISTRDQICLLGQGKTSENCLRLNQSDDSTSQDVPNRSLEELLLPSKTCRVDQMSGTDLAYIGDVVFELFIRSRHVWPSKRTSDLQKLVVNTVRGKPFAYSWMLLQDAINISNFPFLKQPSTNRNCWQS